MAGPENEIRPDELDLKDARGGLRLKLRVKAGGRRDALLGTHGGALKLSVRAAPEKGKANKAVIALLAEELGIPVASIELVSGAASPDKVVELALDRRTLLRRLRRVG